MTDTNDDEGRFELYRADGREWFQLLSHERVLLRSEATRDDAIAELDRLRHSSTRLRPCMTAAGRFYFIAQSVDGDVLATSPSFEVPAERDTEMALAAKLVQGPPSKVRIVDT